MNQQYHQHNPSQRQHKNVYERKNIMLRTFLSVFLVFYVIYGIEAIGLGKTYPEKSYVNLNEEFTVTCELNPEFYEKLGNGSLEFSENGHLVASQFIQKITNTKIVLRNSVSKPSKKNYTCKMNGNGVSYSEVIVDQPPGKVGDFKCRTYDLVSMDCGFTKMENFITISYSLACGIGEKKPEKCDLKGDMKKKYSLEKPLMIPKDNLQDQIYYFNLSSKNRKGQTFEETFKISLLDTVQSKSQMKVLPYNATDQSVLLNMTLQPELIPVKDFLEFDGNFRAEFHPKNTWKKVDLSGISIDADGQIQMQLTNLEFPAANHNFKIRVKTKSSNLWSPTTNSAFKTKPKIPEIPPEICANCFNLMDNDNLFFYWKEVPRKFQFGTKFQYHLTLTGDEGKFRRNLILKDKTWHHVDYGKFNESLTVQLESKNIMGSSIRKGTLKIPKLSEIRAKKAMLKIKKEFLNKNHYKVSWKLMNLRNITGFTILWCRTMNDMPNQCDGDVNFRDLPANQTEFFLEIKETVNFAVGGIFGDQFYGVEWAGCTAAKSDDIGKVSSVWFEEISTKSANVSWHLNCHDEFIVASYKLNICKVESEANVTCLNGTEREENLPHTDNYTHRMEKLKSSQLYRIQISLVSKSGREGVFSAPVFLKTLEAIPTPPRNLQILNVTNTSISLTWESPLDRGGPLMHYVVYYNGVADDRNNNTADVVNYELTGLRSNTNYTISVLACTFGCSIAEKTITVLTKFGIPDPIQAFIYNEDNSFKWIKPELSPHYYQLKYAGRIYRIPSDWENCTINFDLCESEGTTMEIRSVNQKFSPSSDSNFVDGTEDCFSREDSYDEERKYFSHWTKLNYRCPYQYPFSMSATPVTIILVCIICVLIYLIAKLYSKYKEMKNIKACLPIGLLENVLLEPNNYDVNNFDLVKNLNVILEEEELKQQNDDQIMKSNTKLEESEIKQFIYNPNTNRTVYQPLTRLSKKPKKTGRVLEAQKSKPNSNYTKFLINNLKSREELSESSVDEYVKMYSPFKNSSIPSSPSEGYLDMSGKSTTVASKSNDYKMFINQVKVTDDGYIGKRISTNLKNLNVKNQKELVERPQNGSYIQLHLK